MMKEIKIIFNDEDINVQTGEMSGRELLTALGTAFIEGCAEFNVEPLSAIESLMDEPEEEKVCCEHYPDCDCYAFEFLEKEWSSLADDEYD